MPLKKSKSHQKVKDDKISYKANEKEKTVSHDKCCCLHCTCISQGRCYNICENICHYFFQNMMLAMPLEQLKGKKQFFADYVLIFVFFKSFSILIFYEVFVVYVYETWKISRIRITCWFILDIAFYIRYIAFYIGEYILFRISIYV